MRRSLWRSCASATPNIHLSGRQALRQTQLSQRYLSSTTAGFEDIHIRPEAGDDAIMAPQYNLKVPKGTKDCTLDISTVVLVEGLY